MIQTFRISDVLRCILLNAPRGPNLACPRDGISGGKARGKGTLWRETLAHRRNRVTLAQWDGMRLAGLASARARTGNRVWEVDRLFLPHDDVRFQGENVKTCEPWEACFLEVLRKLIEDVAWRQAERIFLRLPSDSPIVAVTRRAGFSPYVEETLLQGWGGGSQTGVAATPAGLQEPLPQDDYALFQLFSAATPQSVRAAVGLTFDQWRDAHEPHCGGRREWVVRANGTVTGWLGLSQLPRVTGVEVLAYPNNPDLWELLVERAVAQEGLQRWLVPDYQELVTSLLLRRKFHEMARYTMMIKTVAVPVVNRGMAAVGA